MVAAEMQVGKAVRFQICFEGELARFADGVHEEEGGKLLSSRKDGHAIN